MRYKANVVEKLSNLENVVQRLEFQLSRNMTGKVVEDTIATLKDSIEDVKSTVELSPDDFASQFGGK